MRNYLHKIRSGDERFPPSRKIAWDVLSIADVRVEDHKKRAGLQLADCATSGFFQGVEPDMYGNYEPRYANILRPKLIKGGNGLALNAGITPVPSLTVACTEDAHKDFFRSFAKTG